jgi:hypothetical protein
MDIAPKMKCAKTEEQQSLRQLKVSLDFIKPEGSFS